MEKVGFGEVFDWIGFKWQQPMIPGEKSWISAKERAEMIERRKGNQLSFFE